LSRAPNRESIIYCTIDFKTKSVELKDKLAEYPESKTYFEKRLKKRINSFVNVPRRHNKEMSEKLWTNNNAESINHVFKIAVNWKPQSTPELINKLYDCVDIQFHHLRGALHFSRDYMPIPRQQHYRIPDQLWRCKTSEEKNDIFNSFLHVTINSICQQIYHKRHLLHININIC
jgi:hypothetical protein